MIFDIQKIKEYARHKPVIISYKGLTKKEVLNLYHQLAEVTTLAHTDAEVAYANYLTEYDNFYVPALTGDWTVAFSHQDAMYSYKDFLKSESILKNVYSSF